MVVTGARGAQHEPESWPPWRSRALRGPGGHIAGLVAASALIAVAQGCASEKSDRGGSDLRLDASAAEGGLGADVGSDDGVGSDGHHPDDGGTDEARVDSGAGEPSPAVPEDATTPPQDAEAGDSSSGGDDADVGIDEPIDENPARGDANTQDESDDPDTGSDVAPTDGARDEDVAIAIEGSVSDGPDQSSATANLIRSTRGQACVDCAAAHGCLDTGNLCDDLQGQFAATGPDAGESREALCLDALTCMLGTRCYLAGNVACICGPQSGFACEMSGPITDAGAQCALQERAGLETVDPSTEIQREADKSFGAGMGYALLSCVIAGRCVTCL
jgi:hypothetical protein